MFSRDQVLTLMRERVHHPAAMRELLQILKVPRDERTTFKRHIKSLVASGELIQIRGHRFGLPEKMDLYVGKLQAHPAGYGFVTPERPLERGDRKSTRLNSSHANISYAVFCLKKKKQKRKKKPAIY